MKNHVLKNTLLISFIFLFSCGTKKSILRIKGSDTEVNLAVALAEAFKEVEPQQVISVSGGGSGFGIASLFNGNTDIANSSRDLNSEEIERFEAFHKTIVKYAFAYDALAIVVSNEMAIDSIGLETLRKIFNGEINNWQSIIPDLKKPINIYGRQSNSGTFEYLKKVLDIQFSQSAMQMNGNSQIMQSIQADPSGIGYVSLGYLTSNPKQKLKALSIKKSASEKAISPLNTEAIMKGDYFFSRPLYQFFEDKDSLKVKAFIDFEKTDKAGQIISKFGYFQNLN